VIHLIVGKKSFEAESLVANYSEVLGEIVRAKPAAAKGKYLRTITMTTTMGPGVPLDTSKTKALLEEEA
jgi:large subunit ribosomal protein L1